MLSGFSVAMVEEPPWSVSRKHVDQKKLATPVEVRLAFGTPPALWVQLTFETAATIVLKGAPTFFGGGVLLTPTSLKSCLLRKIGQI